MKKPKKISSVLLEAIPSGVEATSGKLVRRNKRLKDIEISAVVFTETEIERMFDGLELLPQINFKSVESDRIQGRIDRLRAIMRRVRSKEE